MGFFSVIHEITKSIMVVEGTDGRQNVSSRADPRGYYNSRDVKRTFTVPFDFQAATALEYAMYWQNTSSVDDLVISSIGANAAANVRLKLWFVSGTATLGNAITPTNMNKTSSKDAEANAREGGTEDTGVGGLTQISLIDFLYVTAAGHQEFRLLDRLRLGQNDAIAIQVFEGSGDVSGTAFGFYERSKN